MKKFFTIIFFLLLSLFSFSQEKMEVVSFSKNETDFDARVHFMKPDFSGGVSALIKIETTKKGFAFESGSAGIVDTDNDKVAEVWVYIPRGAIKLKILHQEYGIITYEFPIEIKEATVYNLKLKIVENKEEKTNSFTQQYFILEIEPKDESVELSIDNSSPITITNGEISQLLDYGSHTYQLKSTLYKTETGVVEISGDTPITKSIKLEPNFGYLNITSTPSSADVMVNNMPVGKTPYKSDKLLLGDYSVKISAPNHTAFTQTYTISKGLETVNVNPNLSSTLSDLSIYHHVRCRDLC